MKAIALTCARCSGRLLVEPGIGLGVCADCATAWDFTTGEKRPIQVLEAVTEAPDEGTPSFRLPFLRFTAAAADETSPIFVMAFAITRIGSPHDDGSKMTVERFQGSVRPGTVDVPPALSLATAAGIARFYALRRFDPDAGKKLRPADVRLREPGILSVRFFEKAGRLVNPITGMSLDSAWLGSAQSP